AAGKPVRLVAITTRLPKPLPDDHVLLPWDRQGKARSGLRRKCAAVASWVAEVSASEIRQVVGVLPPAAINTLLAKVAGLSSSPPSAATSPTTPPNTPPANPPTVP